LKITLINIQISEGNNIVPPLGILYIASVLESMQHEVQVFDIDPDVSDCLQEIEEFGPDLIGLSCYTNTYNRALRFNKRLRQALPGAILVVGGVHATARPLETMAEMRPDYLVYAEGERAISQLVNLIDAGTREGIEDIKGLYYWRDEQIWDNCTPDLIDDLDSIPFPARHLLNFEGKGIRRRTAENVIEEIELLVKESNINGFYICDDLVTGDHDWIMEFSEKLADRKLDLVWACQSRVDTLDEQMALAMKKSGCIQIDFGVESGSDKTLKTMKKATTVEAARQMFAMIKRVGVRSCATFILGFEGETEQDMEETFSFAKEINADFTAFYFLTPYPGTPIYYKAVENKWLDPGLAQSDRFTHRQVDFPLMAIEHTPERLAAIRRRFQNYFFIRNYFRWHNLRFYVSILNILCRRPADTGRCIASFFKTLRLDDLVESVFEIHQRWHRTRILRVAPARHERSAIGAKEAQY